MYAPIVAIIRNVIRPFIGKARSVKASTRSA